MKAKTRKTLIVWVIGLYLAQFFVHGQYMAQQWVDNYAKFTKGGSVLTNNVSPDQVMLELFGFREFLSGILWVKADSFFDSGNYDAVLPIIRLCTILDPNDIDVFATGMWHIAYNFTDEDQRSDRRYIAPALALGKEGAAANPETYELFFENGWIWYHKIDDDYDRAVDWFKQANDRSDVIPARRNLLGHAQERADQPDQEVETFYKNLGVTQKSLEPNGSQFQTVGGQGQLDTLNDNIDNTLIRMTQRGWFAEKGGYYDKGDYDTKPPFETGFSAKVTVESEKVIHVQGTWNVLPVGTRIRLIVRDEEIWDQDHKERIDKPGEMDWDSSNGVNLEPPKDVTYLQDQGYVKNREFDKRLDMSKDPTMYPFSAKQKHFLVEFYYNPRSAPSHIQDKFGFNGEGMTDKTYLNTTIRPNQRCVYAVLSLDRDQVLRRGAWKNQVPVVETSNFDESRIAGKDSTIITLGTSLRSQSAGAPPSK
jgi:hypothetical protein